MIQHTGKTNSSFFERTGTCIYFDLKHSYGTGHAFSQHERNVA